MTTSPVMGITEELLAELEAKANDSFGGTGFVERVTGFSVIDLVAEVRRLREILAQQPAPLAADQPDAVKVPRELLAEAESIIDSYAEALKASHAPGGDWEGEEAALDDYEREAGVASKLRALLAGGAE